MRIYNNNIPNLYSYGSIPHEYFRYPYIFKYLYRRKYELNNKRLDRIQKMIGKNIEISSMESLFLLTLYNENSLSGSEILKRLEKNLGEEWSPSPGATYKTVQSLEKKELIKETTEKENRKDQRIRTYSLTEKGKNLVPKITQRVNKVVQFAVKCCPECCEDDSIITKREEN